MLKKKTSQPKLDKWLLRKGDCPFEEGSFKGPDPLQTLKNAFQDFCVKSKPNQAKKDRFATWGLFLALKDSLSTLKEAKLELEKSHQELANLKENFETESSKWRTELEDLKENFETESSKWRTELEDLKEELEHQTHNWAAERLNLILGKQSYATALQDSNQKLEMAMNQIQVAEQKTEELDKQLTKATQAAKYLAEQNQIKRQAASHVECKKEIQSLKDKLELQHAVISTVHPDALVDFQLEEVNLPSQGNSCNSGWIQPQPVEPVTTRRTTSTNTNNGRSTTQIIRETREWRPDEVKAIAEQLGPLSRATSIAWMTNLAACYPRIEGTDLSQLAKRCISNQDLPSLTSYINSRRLHTYNMYNWMREILSFLWSYSNVKVMYVMEKHGIHEDLESYMARKQLLAVISEEVTLDGNGDPQYDNRSFKEALVDGLNHQARLILGLIDFNNTPWNQLEEKLWRVAALLRSTGGLKNHEVSQRDTEEEPVQAVTYSSCTATSQAAAPMMQIISNPSKAPSLKHQVYLSVNKTQTQGQVDSGATLTSVHKRLVKECQLLPGEVYKVKPYESPEIFVPKAKVQLEFKGWKGTWIVAVHSRTETPVLLGNDFCDFVNKQRTPVKTLTPQNPGSQQQRPVRRDILCNSLENVQSIYPSNSQSNSSRTANNKAIRKQSTAAPMGRNQSMTAATAANQGEQPPNLSPLPQEITFRPRCRRGTVSGRFPTRRRKTSLSFPPLPSAQ